MASADTIAAVSTAPGRGAIGVVRISGPCAKAIAEGLLGKTPPARNARFVAFRDRAGEAIDQGIALYFSAPASYTGEDVLELHAHGGPMVLRALLRRALELGARPAEPGEFTRRAYMNAKLDLAQAESVADIIEAASEQAAKSAMRSLQGAFSKEISSLDQELVELRMLAEAVLDFPEEDVEMLEERGARARLSALNARLDKVLAAATQGSILREGLRVVLVGRPNVGKSSLLNKLAGEDVAIVTAIAGTTRDAIQRQVDIEGVPLHIIDTAGLQAARDEVEKIGIERTWAAVETADIALLLLDLSANETETEPEVLGKLSPKTPRLKVFNKIDLTGATPRIEEGETPAVYISAKTGAGLEFLRARLLQLAGWEGAEGIFMARERHLRALHEAKDHLARAGRNWPQLELFAEELKLARNALNSILGEFTSDDLLGEIFSRFCIGK